MNRIQWAKLLLPGAGMGTLSILVFIFTSSLIAEAWQTVYGNLLASVFTLTGLFIGARWVKRNEG